MIDPEGLFYYKQFHCINLESVCNIWLTSLVYSTTQNINNYHPVGVLMKFLLLCDAAGINKVNRKNLTHSSCEQQSEHQ